MSLLINIKTWRYCAHRALTCEKNPEVLRSNLSEELLNLSYVKETKIETEHAHNSFVKATENEELLSEQDSEEKCSHRTSCVFSGSSCKRSLFHTNGSGTASPQCTMWNGAHINLDTIKNL